MNSNRSKEFTTMSKKEKRFIIDKIENNKARWNTLSQLFFSKVFVERWSNQRYIESLKEAKIFEAYNRFNRIEQPPLQSEDIFTLIDSSVLDTIENKTELKITLEDDLDYLIDIEAFKFKINKSKLSNRYELFGHILNMTADEKQKSVKDYRKKDRFSVITLKFEDIEKVVFLSFGINNPNNKSKKWYYLMLLKMIDNIRHELYQVFALKLFVTYRQSDLKKMMYFNEIHEDIFNEDMFRDPNFGTNKRGISIEMPYAYGSPKDNPHSSSNTYVSITKYVNFGKLYLIINREYDLSEFGVSYKGLHKTPKIKLNPSDYELYEIHSKTWTKLVKDKHPKTILIEKDLEKILDGTWLCKYASHIIGKGEPSQPNIDAYDFISTYIDI